MAHHVFFPDIPAAPGGSITITGDEAHHALRVKRLVTGDPIVLSDGKGRTAHTKLAGSDKTREGWAIRLEVVEVQEVPPVRPAITVLSSTPKGDRLESMIDGLSQVGARAWHPLTTKRTVVDPREGKLERLHRVAIESLKQSGRAWLLEIGAAVPFAQAIKRPGRVVLADASGTAYAPAPSEEITILIGPEGGWTDDELAQAREAGVTIARFGPHIMRIEVAAVAAVACVLAAHAS